MGHRGQSGVPGTEPPGPRHRADDEGRHVIGPGLAGDARGQVPQPPAVEPMREQRRRGPGEDVEQEVEMGAGGDVEQRGAFAPVEGLTTGCVLCRAASTLRGRLPQIPSFWHRFSDPRSAGKERMRPGWILTLRNGRLFTGTG